jgi:hypothetical protein
VLSCFNSEHVGAAGMKLANGPLIAKTATTNLSFDTNPDQDVCTTIEKSITSLALRLR